MSIRFINFETEVLLYLLTAKNNVPTSRMGFTDKFMTLRCQGKIFGATRIKVRAKKKKDLGLDLHKWFTKPTKPVPVQPGSAEDSGPVKIGQTGFATGQACFSAILRSIFLLF